MTRKICRMTVALMLLVTMMLPATLKAAQAEEAAVTGVFTHTYGYDYLYNCFSNTIKNNCSNDSDIFENDQLILFNNDEGYNKDRGEKDPYRGVWDNGSRYILTRDLYVVNLGMHLSQTYLGYYTAEDEKTVVLESPVIFSYAYMYGDATRWEDTYATAIVVDKEAETTVYDEETGHYSFAAENSGRYVSGLYGFDVPFADYHHAGNGADVTVIVDVETMTYEIEEE